MTRRIHGLLLPAVASAVALTSLASVGCVRRIVRITSEPSSATVWLNDREIGRTPCEAEFTYYGTYDVRLALDGHEPLDTSAEAVAPAWDYLGPDLIAEALPTKLTSLNAWHFVLTPAANDHAALLERAKAMREAMQPVTESASEATTSPAANSAAGSTAGSS
jgi:PEGA domain